MKNFKNIFLLLSKKEKTSFSILLILIFVGMILESVGVGLIIPIVNIIFNPDIFNSIVVKLNISHKEFIIIVFASSIFFFFFKFSYLTFLSFIQNKFTSYFTHNISYRLLGSYLYREYKYFSKLNSSEYAKNIFIESGHFATYFNALINFLIDLCFTISLMVILIFIEPLGAIFVILLFSVGAFTIYRITKSKLVRWGQERKGIDNRLTKTTIEGFNSIREIKVLGVESYFLKIFKINNDRKADIFFKHHFFSQLPKNFLELLTFTGLIFFIIITISFDKELVSILAKLSVFGAAAFKIITSVNRILSNYQQINYYTSSINIVIEDLNFKQNELTNENKLFKKIIRIKLDNLTFNYIDKPVLKNINLLINSGENVCISGISGSGKSTLLDILLGLQEKVSGQFLINNINLSREYIKSWQSKIGYVPQKIFLLDDSIENNITLGSLTKDDLWLKFLLDKLELKTINEEYSNNQSTIGENGINLSGGQIQRIAIARALYRKPEILILDEFTNNLDQINEDIVLGILNDHFQNSIIIFTTHKSAPVKIADKIYKLKDNELKEVIHE